MTDIDGPKQYNQFKFHNLSSQAVPLTYNKYFIRSKYLGCSPSSQHCSQIKIHNIYPPQALPPIVSQRYIQANNVQQFLSAAQPKLRLSGNFNIKLSQNGPIKRIKA